MEIKINEIGKIVSGDDAGWFLKIQDCRGDSGGLLILIAPREDFSGGFDYWVESEVDLENFFMESMWVVDWM